MAFFLSLALAAQEPALAQAEFEELHAKLRPPEDEAWRAIPWKTSLVEACLAAAREKKPLFMVVRSGHPLGPV
jgi:hypothetical protein